MDMTVADAYAHYAQMVERMLLALDTSLTPRMCYARVDAWLPLHLLSLHYRRHLQILAMCEARRHVWTKWIGQAFIPLSPSSPLLASMGLLPPASEKSATDEAHITLYKWFPFFCRVRQKNVFNYLTRRDAFEKGYNEKCPICMSKIEFCSSFTQLPCGHLFLTTCILEWMLYQKSCPCCRSLVQMQMHDLDYTSLDPMRGNPYRLSSDSFYVSWTHRRLIIINP